MHSDLFRPVQQRLGEMVIGAFKYAGRRRMAFSVGTTIAQFQKELGLVNEAEELLSDICKFYSEDQWTQLSTNAFALLAGCQLKLKMEDKYPHTGGEIAMWGYKCPQGFAMWGVRVFP